MRLSPYIVKSLNRLYANHSFSARLSRVLSFKNNSKNRLPTVNSIFRCKTTVDRIFMALTVFEQAIRIPLEQNISFGMV